MEKKTKENVQKRISYSPFNWGWGDRLSICAFIAVLLALFWRITQGIDFSDESYYAIFIDDWLKGGIATSTFATLHQTAALVVYPAAWLYYTITGSSDGLFLFLRILFVLGSTVTALTWFAFSYKILDKSYAWAIVICVLLIVPFGLPAPSYNTLCGQFLFIALSAFGSGVLSHGAKKRQAWLVLSAIAWALAVVAYPTLFVVLVFFVLLLGFFGRGLVPRFWIYCVFLFFCQLALWAIVVHVLSWQHLQESFTYLASINNSHDFSKKFFSSLNLLREHKSFTVLALLALGIGVLHRWISARIQTICLVAILVVLCFLPPTLFVRSHDAITLVALTGFWLIFALFSKETAPNRLFALLYSTSFLAGCVTAGTALYGLYNFCIGAAPAAMLSIMVLAITLRVRWFYFVAIILLAAILFNTAFFYHYGELPSNSEKREWIKEHFFAGLAVPAAQIALLNLMESKIVPWAEMQKTILVVGRLPGLALMTPARIRALIAYPLAPPISKKTRMLTQKFYAKVENRPKMILVYEDKYLSAVNPLEPNFSIWYKKVGNYTVSLGDPEGSLGRLTLFLLR